MAVGDQELVVVRDNLSTLFIAEQFEAIDPSARFCGDGVIVGVGCDLERAHRMKIGKGKLLHGLRGLRRKMLGAQGVERGTGGSWCDPRIFL